MDKKPLEEHIIFMDEPLKKVDRYVISPTLQFIGFSSMVFVCFVSYGYILELSFTLDGIRDHGWFLTLLQFGFYAIFATMQLLALRKEVQRRIPMKTYLLISILTVGTMGFSNTSMGYLNYPTQVIFKSCKLIPVMIGSTIILKKTYNAMQVLSCILMSLGLIWFTLADTTVQPNFNSKGILLISCALLCDAVIGNVQEGAMKSHDESTTIVILYSYSIGFCLILTFLLTTGSLGASITFCIQNSWVFIGRAFLLSVTGFCGVQVVLLMITKYGALVTVTVTTFRKALSICLSFLVFTKPFTMQYIWSGCLVALGIYINVVFKNQSSTSILVFIQKYFLKRSMFHKSDQFKSNIVMNV